MAKEKSILASFAFVLIATAGFNMPSSRASVAGALPEAAGTEIIKASNRAVTEHQARPLIKVINNDFSPVEVSLSGARDSTAEVTIAASPACSYPGCLKAGDFVVIEIILGTVGGSFTYDSRSQQKKIPLVLGDATTARFLVTVVEASTVPKEFDFTVRVLDVRRPAGDGGYTSIEEGVELDPPSGGVSRPLKVNP